MYILIEVFVLVYMHSEKTSLLFSMSFNMSLIFSQTMNSTKICALCRRNQAKDQFISKANQHIETTRCLGCRESSINCNKRRKLNPIRQINSETTQPVNPRSNQHYVLRLNPPPTPRPQTSREGHRDARVAAPKHRRILPKPIIERHGCVGGSEQQSEQRSRRGPVCV